MAQPIDELKNRLKNALAKSNMKPIELSEMTSIPKSSISQYMSGYAKPNSERVYLISKALDVSEAWLMGFDVPMRRGTENSQQNKPTKEKYNPAPIIQNPGLTSDEQELLEEYRRLNNIGKDKVKEYISDLTDNEKYTSEQDFKSKSS